LNYITFLLACGITSAFLPRWEHTSAERTRLLGPLAFAESRIPFTCTAVGPSAAVPTSAHAVRPADIQYMGAMGDSLTAANGAKATNIFGLLTQNRGVAWSIGGDANLDSVITLPNIMRKFNSQIVGPSTGNGDETKPNANFNVAKAGAVSADMPKQAQSLVDKMEKALGAKFSTEWKLVTFFIGGNDLCAYCKDVNRYSVANYKSNIEQALNILHSKMPRTIVNFVTVLNVAELEDLNEGLQCKAMQGFLCDCAVNKNTREQVRIANLEYQRVTNALIDSGKYDTKTDFTIIRQPFMEHMKVPLTPAGLSDFSYFAPDCFHFSKKGHEAAAVELWNNMMEPVGKKTTVWNLLDTLHCPPQGHGFIYTTKNSA
jgi:phospholipase B1